MSEPRPEFSFPVDVTSLPPSGRRYEIEADEAARARVAQRLGLAALSSLRARFDLGPRAGGIVGASGVVEASFTQTCVATLAPVPAAVREDVDVKFTILPPAKLMPKPAGKDRGKGEPEPEEEVEIGAEEPPEEALDGRIDLGELAVIHLALGLDPYPRAPGATFDAGSWNEKGEKTVAESPFAALAIYRPRSPPAKGE